MRHGGRGSPAAPYGLRMGGPGWRPAIDTTYGRGDGGRTPVEPPSRAADRRTRRAVDGRRSTVNGQPANRPTVLYNHRVPQARAVAAPEACVRTALVAGGGRAMRVSAARPAEGQRRCRPSGAVGLALAAAASTPPSSRPCAALSRLLRCGAAVLHCCAAAAAAPLYAPPGDPGRRGRRRGPARRRPHRAMGRKGLFLAVPGSSWPFLAVPGRSWHQACS